MRPIQAVRELHQEASWRASSTFVQQYFIQLIVKDVVNPDTLLQRWNDFIAGFSCAVEEITKCPYPR
jgi:hypothetical protein